MVAFQQQVLAALDAQNVRLLNMERQLSSLVDAIATGYQPSQRRTCASSSFLLHLSLEAGGDVLPTLSVNDDRDDGSGGQQQQATALFFDDILGKQAVAPPTHSTLNTPLGW